jgi:uncharacterized membrane protein
MAFGIVFLAMLVTTFVAVLGLIVSLPIWISAIAYPVTGVLFIGVVLLLPYLKDASSEP